MKLVHSGELSRIRMIYMQSIWEVYARQKLACDIFVFVYELSWFYLYTIYSVHNHGSLVSIIMYRITENIFITTHIRWLKSLFLFSNTISLCLSFTRLQTHLKHLFKTNKKKMNAKWCYKFSGNNYAHQTWNMPSNTSIFHLFASHSIDCGLFMLLQLETKQKKKCAMSNSIFSTEIFGFITKIKIIIHHN